MLRSLTCLTVLAMCAPVFGQNLLTNGSFQDPPITPGEATVTITAPGVADGDTIEIDTAGANRVYEFDTDAAITGDVLVDVSADQSETAAITALVAAINGDASAPCTASDDGGGVATLTWKVNGGYDATNTNNTDANGTIDVTDFAQPGGCPGDGQGVTGWTWDDDTAFNRRNGSFFIAECRDGAHASFSITGGASRYMYQTVTGLTPGAEYTLSGVTTIGNNQSGCRANMIAHVLNGDKNAAEIRQANKLKWGPGQTDWVGWSVQVQAGELSTDTLTVKIEFTGTCGAWAVHVDDVSLQAGLCLPQPDVTGVTPDHANNTQSSVGITIDGTNLGTLGSTSAKLTKSGEADIPVSITSANGAQIVGTVNLNGAAQGRWSVEVDVSGGSGCPPNGTLSDGFNVILPAFSNGSFENPDPGNLGCTDATENPVNGLVGLPTDWLKGENFSYGWDGALYRDEIDTFPPTCPPPDGDHYASSSTNEDNGSNAWLYQSFSVNPSSTYTLSGYFAGGGNNTVTLFLLNGEETSTPDLSLGSLVSQGQVYDWSYAYTTTTATSDIMTAQWFISTTGDAPHANHADALVVEECVNQVSITGMSPGQAVNDAVIDNATIQGSGFSAGTPIVLLSGNGVSITASDVQVGDNANLTCDFDITGIPSGTYSVSVKQGGCVDTLPGALQVIASEFINGSFEEPASAGHDPCTGGRLGGTPTGWNSDAPGGLFRDDQAPTPSSCPSPDGGHYGSMSEGGGGTVRAWQTIAVNPGWTYKFSGMFDASANVAMALRLNDGPINGQELEATTFTGPVGWVYQEVEATAPASGVMTVVWELSLPGGVEPGGHADGLVFESTISCGDPFADTDGDGDVDATDFAAFQRCFGETDPVSDGCKCLDNPVGGGIGQSDWNRFQNCSSGANVLADPACDDY